jgi:hypothetical protein
MRQEERAKHLEVVSRQTKRNGFICDNQMNREDTVPSEYTEAETKLCILSEMPRETLRTN